MPASTALNGDEVRLRHLGDDARQRRLAGAGRSPQDDRLEQVALDRLAQRPAGREDLVLADDLVERARPHPLGERRARLAAAALGAAGPPSRRLPSPKPSGRSRSKRDPLMRRAAAARRRRGAPPATATLSDSTGGAIGIVTRSSHARDDLVARGPGLRRRAAGRPCRASRRRRGRSPPRGDRGDRAQARRPPCRSAPRPTVSAGAPPAGAARCPCCRAAPSTRTDSPTRRRRTRR